jgi:outer membrane protein OmpA-like peptidoglycan-associated protein
MRRSTLALPLALGLLASQALANGVNIQNFTPSAGSDFVFSETGGPGELPPGANPDSYRRYYLGFNYNYLNSPLVELNAAGTQRTGTIVDSIQTFNVLAGIEWDGRFQLNVDLPLNLVGMPGSSGQFTAGDIRFFPKIYLNDRGDPVQFAFVPELRLPTGDPTLFASEDGVSYGLSLAIERDFGPLAAAVNFGYRYSPYAQFEDLDYRNRLPMSLSLGVPVTRELSFNAEAAAQVIVPFNKTQNPSELYGGLNYHATREVSLMAGAAVGSFNQTSSSDYRVVTGLRFSPVSSDPLPQPKPVQNAGIAPAPEPVPTAPMVVEKVVVKEAEPRTIVKLVPTPARVVYTEREIKVRDEIIFEHNSDKLAKPSKELLREVATVIKQNQGRFKKIRIEGHTNELGTDAYNLKLSQRRALAVKKYLTQLGVPTKKLASIGFGKRQPRVTSTSGYLRDTRLVLNRRVEFKVLN